MKEHALILSTAKIIIPDAPTIEFVTGLVNRGLTLIEYFGVELDNPCDFVEVDMAAVSAGITYIEFFFETEDSIDYDSFDELQAEKLILEVIGKTSRYGITCDEKDIFVHIH